MDRMPKGEEQEGAGKSCVQTSNYFYLIHSLNGTMSTFLSDHNKLPEHCFLTLAWSSFPMKLLDVSSAPYPSWLEAETESTHLFVWKPRSWNNSQFLQQHQACLKLLAQQEALFLGPSQLWSFWASAPPSLSAAHPSRGAKSDLERRQYTVPLRVGRVLHQNCFWRDLLALSLSTLVKPENSQTPRGEKKEDKRIFLLKGRRDHYQSHREEIKKSCTKQRGRLFQSEGWTASWWSTLVINFYSPHICWAYIPPN